MKNRIAHSPPAILLFYQWNHPQTIHEQTHGSDSLAQLYPVPTPKEERGDIRRYLLGRLHIQFRLAFK